MNEMYHYGIKGMKWGRRRFQNTDGSLTPAGKKRYLDYNESNTSTLKQISKSKYVKTGAKVTAAVLFAVGMNKVTQDFNDEMMEKALRNLREVSGQ